MGDDMQLRNIIVIVMLAAAAPVMATTYTVLPDGSGDFSTIQAAMYAAGDGDVIQLGDGVFTGPGNRDLDTNETNFSLVSVSGNPALCVIDCQGSAADPHYGIAYVTNAASALLRGITIKNGWANPSGGALILDDAYITVDNCVFTGNTAYNFGGAVAALQGSAPTFQNCVFRDNSAVYYGQGGALYFEMAGAPALNGCTFAGNTAEEGGAVYFDAGSPTVSASTFFGNQPGAFHLGAGCALDMGTSLLAYNRGAAAALAGSGTAVLTCCDIYGNQGGDWTGSIAGQFGLDGNISADPQLIDPWTGNFNIATASPCGTYVNPACGRIGAGFAVAAIPTYVVRADGTGMLSTIQAAVDTAPQEAVISLEDGTYAGTGNRNIYLRGKLLRIEGRGGSAASVIIDAGGTLAMPARGFNLINGEPEGTILQHLTIRGGFCNDDPNTTTGRTGAGIKLSAGASLKVLSCRFEDNTSYKYQLIGADLGRGAAIHSDGGGVLWLEDCSFAGNTGSQSVLANDCQLVALNCTFVGDSGGIRVIRPVGSTNIAGCVFEAFTEWGVVCIESVDNVRLYSCSFTAPGALVEGAIGISECQSAVIEQCQVTELIATDWLTVGQPVVSVGSANGSIRDCTFAGNGGGETLSISNSDWIVDNCTFTGNGGQLVAQAVVKVLGGAVDFSLCTFADNMPTGGGAVFADATTISFDQCQFTGNHANGRGAGARFTASTVTVRATGFTGNTANEGGGIYADRCNLTVDGCTFDGNSNGLRSHGSSIGGVTITGTTFANHTAGWAAEIDSMLVRPVVIDRCTFSGGPQGLRLEQVPVFRIANSEFSDNAGVRGMEIENSAGAVDTCTFARNSAADQGGGAYLLNSDVDLRDCVFTDNLAVERGGAVMVEYGSAGFTACGFTGNSVGNSGGAVAGIRAALGLAHCTFTANLADTTGAGLYTMEGQATVDTCTFHGGTSGQIGGGAYHLRGTVQYNGGLIEGNQAQLGGGISTSNLVAQYNGLRISGNTGTYGGGLAAFVSDITLTDCQISGNDAEQYGGMYIYNNSTAVVSGSLVTDNTSTLRGSGVSLINSTTATFLQSTLAGNGGVGSQGQVVCDENSHATLSACITAFAADGPAVAVLDTAGTIQIETSDVFGNAGGDWVGPLAGLNGTSCNFSLDPEFCDPGTDNYHLADASPCAGVNNFCGLPVGALDTGCTTVSSVTEPELPRVFALLGNTPNPFNPITRIAFELPAPGLVVLRIYDVSGRLVRHLVSGGSFPAGRHELVWDGRDDAGQAQSSGVYLYRVETAGRALGGKMALLR